ncbi:MAG: ATP-binding cassette domain-containing protein [Pseudomonadota bacterium]
MALTTQALARSFGRKAVLTDVTAQFPVGLTLLTGPSGAGKSTLLRLLATADKPTKGTVSWEGVPLPKGRRALRRVLGYAPQAVDLPETLTAREFALHIAALKGLSLGQADAQFAGIADRMRLGEDIDRPIAAFSGGMRRRLITAQALLGDPQVIALDEPTAELDAESAAITHELVLERAERAAVIMTTHLARELEQHAVQNLRVENGLAVAAGSSEVSAGIPGAVA